MPSVTESGLKLDQLKHLANEPEQTRRQIEAVLYSLTGTDEEVQWACEALENCGSPHVSSTAPIAQFIEHNDELVASWACKLLGRLGSDASKAEAQLVRALLTRSEDLVREEAAHALGQLGILSDAARAALTSAASSGSARLKRLATASLGG